MNLGRAAWLRMCSPPNEGGYIPVISVVRAGPQTAALAKVLVYLTPLAARASMVGVLASEYNTRPLIPEGVVNGDQFAVIRPRPTFDEMINRDTIPEWL